MPKIDNADEGRVAALESAVEDVRDSISYYLNVVNTALDYYQNQLGGRIKGEVCLIGDGFRLAGIKRCLKMRFHFLYIVLITVHLSI